MGKEKGKSSGLLPNSLRIISSCIKAVSTNASTVVRSISASGDDRKEQVTWVGFDKLELPSTALRHVLLLGYQTGFQVIDVEDASNFTELLSKRDDPVTFLQMLPIPAKSDGNENIRLSHPLLLVVARDETNRSSVVSNWSHTGGAPGRDSSSPFHAGSSVNSPTAVRFYSLQSNSYVKTLRFRSTVLMVRCSPLIVAVGFEDQIRCVDALTLEDKFVVPTYPVPQVGGQGEVGFNIGYGPMAVGPRWLAYSSNDMLVLNTGRLNPKNLGPAMLTSPSNSTLMARYAMESSKQLAAGIVNIGDRGYRAISKYCSDLLPDGPSSPVSLKSDWKGFADPETNKPGLVVVKDVVSEAVISQFKAHTTPICALCLDPSGTILVTASMHGTSIKIFRIIPSTTRSGSSSRGHDWSSSHVHLYTLCRGLTKAIIQDICFSRLSQWISVVSSKGTCHIFFISPFGGDTGYGTHSFHDPALDPVISLPWWSSSSLTVNQQPSPPPPPVTLSVVGRIKDNTSGLFNTVSNAASSAAGKGHIPSGALAAVFHNSLAHDFQDIHNNGHSLEHLLVYSPSGHVIQYELQPLTGVQPIVTGSKTQSGPYSPMRDEEFKIIVEPLQWWDVCRRPDSLEREACISASISDGQDPSNVTHGYQTTGGQNLLKSETVKCDERSPLFISSAEVQINTGRSPFWHKSKVHFHTMSSQKEEGVRGEETEIEKVPFHEVEIRQKDLLPVFDHSHRTKLDWTDRDGEGYPSAASLEPRQNREKVTGETVYCHSKPASLSSTSSDGGSSRRIDNFPDLDQVSNERTSAFAGYTLGDMYQERRGSSSIEFSGLNQTLIRAGSFPREHSIESSSNVGNTIADGFFTLGTDRRVLSEGAPSSNAGGIIQVPLLTDDHFSSAGVTGQSTPSDVKKPEDFAPLLQEGYCNEVKDDFDIQNGDNQRERENSENDGAEDDDLLGGMFDPF